MEEIIGYVQAVVFNNASNQYSIARFKIDQKKTEIITIVGYFEIPKKHELVKISGEYVEHSRFGMQFRVDYLEKVLPQSEEAVVRFLSSSLFKGIGTKSANIIVDELGENALHLIKEDPSVLDRVNIKKELKETIINVLETNSKFDEMVKLFVSYGIEMRYLIKMEAVYGRDLIKVIEQDPYLLLKNVEGLSFNIVDKIAFNMGLKENDERRLKSLLPYVASQICFQTQDTYFFETTLYSTALRLLPTLTTEEFENALNLSYKYGSLVVEDHKIFPANLYIAEVEIAKYLSKYMKIEEAVDYDFIDREIKVIEDKIGIKYSEEQIEAMKMVFEKGVSIISGGPGTGKTTIVNAIIKLYEKLNPKALITISAPTGRAAKRLTSITNKQATTIHSFLKWDLDTNEYGINYDNAHEGDFLIVDEFSMVDSDLFHHLLAGTHPYKKILLIGDEEQLPPVSPGDVLRDMLASNLIAIKRLNSIFRQQDDSHIIPLSYEIRNGEISSPNVIKNDVSFTSSYSKDVPSLIINEIKNALEEGYDFQDVQVLAPMYDKVAGVTNLNYLIRELLNPAAVNLKEIKSGSIIFREKDKVIQLKNQPTDNVYNGDIGFIEEIEINPSNKGDYTVYVNFDGEIVTYKSGDMYKLDHAYCISIHKSQGSEYRYVIIPFIREHRVMLKKKLIYTAVSRAKERLALFGSYEAFSEGVKIVEQNTRKTTLKERLKNLLL